MKKEINFEDSSYISVEISPTPDKIYIAIGAKQADNPRATVINSVEISTAQLQELVCNFQTVKITKAPDTKQNTEEIDKINQIFDYNKVPVANKDGVIFSLSERMQLLIKKPLKKKPVKKKTSKKKTTAIKKE